MYYLAFYKKIIIKRYQLFVDIDCGHQSFCLCFDVCKKPLKMRQNKAGQNHAITVIKVKSYLLSSALTASVFSELSINSASILTV